MHEFFEANLGKYRKSDMPAGLMDNALGSSRIAGWKDEVYTVHIAKCPNDEVQAVRLVRLEDGRRKDLTLLESEETLMTLVDDPAGWESPLL